MLDPGYDWNEEDEAGMPPPLQDYEALARERAERDEESDQRRLCLRRTGRNVAVESQGSLSTLNP